MKSPDITLAQILTVVGSALALGAAFGLDLSQEKQDAILQFVTVFAPVALVADAYIRNGRSRVAAAKASPRSAPAPKARPKR